MFQIKKEAVEKIFNLLGEVPAKYALGLIQTLNTELSPVPEPEEKQPGNVKEFKGKGKDA